MTGRVDAAQKVRGAATYAYDQPFDNPAYVYPVLATVAKGRLTRIDTSSAEAADGVLAVLTHENAPRLADTDDRELCVLQSAAVSFREQIVGAVVAETREAARYAAGLVHIEYEREPHDTVLEWGPFTERPDVEHGDTDSAFAHAVTSIDRTYTTPMEHNNPMEPHAVTARWDPDADLRLTLYDSTQGVHTARSTLAPIFGLPVERLPRQAPTT